MDILKIKKTYGIETAMLILISRVFLKTATLDTLKTFILNNSINWEKLYDLSSAQRIRPIVYKVLLPLKENIETEAFLKFRSFYILFSMKTLKREKEALRIINLLNEKKVSVRLYKGIDFAKFAYDDIFMREFSDIDMIVSRADLETIIEIMKEEGYKMTSEAFFKKFPDQYFHSQKDISFSKSDVQGDIFNFEFHYKPTKNHVDLTSAFSDILGIDYLATNIKLNTNSYFELMLISNGVTDYFPNLRSLIDLGLVFTEDKIGSDLKVFKQLWFELSSSLLNFPDSSIHNKNTLACNIIIRKILHKKKFRLSFVTITYLNMLTSSGFKKKCKFLFRRLSNVFIPTNKSIKSADFKSFFVYRVINIIFLINKHVIRPNRQKKLKQL